MTLKKNTSMKILLTSTSFQDTPGKHQDLLASSGLDVDTIRGPVDKNFLLPIISNYDGVICGDDEYDYEVLKKGKFGKLKVLSKYGIGLDKIDTKSANRLGIIVTNCPGVNHVAVAEHVFGLMLSFFKNIPRELEITKKNKWIRYIGNELYGKKIGVAGLGRIGKEILIRAKSFGLETFAYDKYIDKKFVKDYDIKTIEDERELFSTVDILSLNMNLTSDNKNFVNKKKIENFAKKGLLIINTARGELVNEEAIIFGIKNNLISGYLTDVLVEEPIRENHPFLKYDNIYITPHIASRNYETVVRQGVKAIDNLLKNLKIV
jgi:D-3-phosphoglycerate dehydrogenase / 2-oxoglutarate reductase